MATLDTLQDAVNVLTTSTTTLVNEVQTKKAVLDAAVDDAQDAQVAAQAARDSAQTSKLAAETAATTATSIASGLAGFDLAAIAESKAVTAVDVFVYDTSKDSDGGAWRKRTQGTSWYNETLSTATRGSRREFPAVAVIVAEAAKVTIYDGDDPSLPMWMVFNTGTGNPLYSVVTSVSALNGHIVVGQNTSNGGLTEIKFVNDYVYLRINNTNEYNGEIIADRNDGGADGVSGTVPNAIVSRTVNDVAMTVLPNAPIDPATGLQVPTIAVATNGGVSVIKDDGTVVDITGYAYAPTKVSIDGNTLWNSHTTVDGTLYAGPLVFAADTTLTSWRYAYYNKTTAAALPTLDVDSLSIPAVGGSGGVSVLAENQATPANGMVAYITSSWNSGYQNGSIKGSFLSDTDDTDLVGSGELVTNGTFDSNISGWTDFSTGTGAISWNASGYLDLISASSDDRARASQAITTVVGKTYIIKFDHLSGPAILIRVGTSEGGSQNVNTSVDTGSYAVTFVATASTSYVSVYGPAALGTISADNISVKLADTDRSVNNKGLIVNGTVTRTPVATGADLVAYSGFSAANYLEQPYNSDLDFGTGDFSVMGWVKEIANSATEVIFSRAYHTGSTWSGSYVQAYFNADGTITSRITDDGGSTKDTITSSSAYDTSTFNLLAIVRRGSSIEMWVNGAKAATDVAITQAAGSLNNASATFTLGSFQDQTSPLISGSLALWRISATAPSANQIAKIYNDERPLFQDGAQATLYGASDAVTALAHDDATDLLHVGTSAGRSVFQGLRRVSNTTTAVGTAISASNGLVVEE